MVMGKGKTILVLGNAWMPHRFYHYKNTDYLNENEIKKLMSQNWMKRHITGAEATRMAGSIDGCLGDILDMYKENKNASK